MIVVRVGICDFETDVLEDGAHPVFGIKNKSNNRKNNQPKLLTLGILQSLYNSNS